MRLIEIEIHNWRLLRNIKLAFHEKGNLIHGPNESGKSTLFDAVRRILFDRARTQSRWAMRFAPYGTAGVLPKGILTFTHNGRHLRVTKEFGGKGTTTLEEKVGGEFKLLAQQEEAEGELRQILEASDQSTQSDGAAPKHWGPFHWLFVPQSARGLPDPESQATQHLGLEQTGITEAYQQVLKAVQKKYAEFYTPTGKLAAHSPLKQAMDDVQKWEEKAAKYREELKKLEDLQREYGQISDELPDLIQRRKQAKEAYEQARAEESGIAGAEVNLNAVKAEVSLAQKEYDSAKEQLGKWGTLTKKLDEARERQKELGKDYAAAEARLQELEKQWKNVREEARNQGDTKAALEKRLKDAKLVLQKRSLDAQISELSQRLDQARKLDHQLLSTKSKLIPHPPTQKTVENATVLNVQWQEKKRASAAAGMKVCRSQDLPATVEIDGHATEEPESVAYQQVRILFPTGGEVCVEADLAQAQDFQEQANLLNVKLQEIFDEFGVKCVEELSELARSQEKIKKEIDSLEKQRKVLDGRKTQEMEEALASLKAADGRLQSLSRHTDCEKEHDSLDDAALELRIQDLEQNAQEAEELFEKTRERRAELDEKYEAFKKEVSQMAQDLALVQQKVESTQDDLDNHRDRYGSEETCKINETTCAQNLKKKQDMEEEAKAYLERLKKGQGIKVKTAKQEYDHLDEIVRNKEQRLILIQEQLDLDALKGTYSQLADAEQAAESAKQRQGRLQIEAYAAEKLRHLLEEEERRAVTTLVKPIKEHLDEALAYATEGDYTTSDLDVYLHPEKITSSIRQVEFEDGSDGLRELVTVLIRLSVAVHLSQEGPQTLFLDDPFIHVYQRRAKRVVELLNQVMEDQGLQVLILTHRPAEFAGIIGKSIDMLSVNHEGSDLTI